MRFAWRLDYMFENRTIRGIRQRANGGGISRTLSLAGPFCRRYTDDDEWTRQLTSRQPSQKLPLVSALGQ
jgi:hypothetical protein